MQSANNVVHLDIVKKANRQEVIDDIGAKAFMYLRDSAEAAGLPVKEVMIEHILGLAMVIGAVEGTETAQQILQDISTQLSAS